MKGHLLVRRFSSGANVSFVDRPFVTNLDVVKHKEVRPMYRVMDRAGKVLDQTQDPNLPKGETKTQRKKKKKKKSFVLTFLLL